MRTTLTIDDDVLFAVKERARRAHQSVGQVLSELARQAMTTTYPDAPAGQQTGRHGFVPFPHRGPAVSNALIDRLREAEPE